MGERNKKKREIQKKKDMAEFRAINESNSVPRYQRANKKDKREIGNQAVWSLSSAKPGFGVEQLRDNDLNTFWQSDGQQPHYVSIQFPKRASVSEISIFVDAKADESYTPQRIAIRSGSNFHDLQEIKVIDLNSPSGWISIPLFHPKRKETDVLKTNLLQVVVLTNHQNGRDTHIRQIHIYGPPVPKFKEHLEFKTDAFNSFLSLK